VLNAITRSGANDYHGNFYHFLRTDNLNARSAFLPRRTNIIQNQFGLTGGGRIIRNKLFYFGTLEFLRIRPEAASVSAFPPTGAERAGDFSAVRTPITDPLTRQPFPSNQIPLSRFDESRRACFRSICRCPISPMAAISARTPRLPTRDSSPSRLITS
jgi:hypothetical protein